MLTKKEKETYDFIIDFQRKYGQFPLLTEIADGIGITSKGVVPPSFSSINFIPL